MGYIIDVQPSAGVALVVGGGAVAQRKVEGLVTAGFAVQVVAPAVRDAIRALSGVLVIERQFVIEDVQGKALVFACTDSRAVNAEVARASAALGTLVLVADSQEESSFFTPAVHRDGDLAVAVSTGGTDPVLAREIRDRVVAALGEGWGERLSAARDARQERLSRPSP